MDIDLTNIRLHHDCTEMDVVINGHPYPNLRVYKSGYGILLPTTPETLGYWIMDNFLDICKLLREKYPEAIIPIADENRIRFDEYIEFL